MNDKLTLQELIDLLAARHQMEPQDADAFVRAFWALIEEGLKSDNYVKIKGLGTFKLIDTEARESINVQTGERIEIQSHARVTFSPEASLRDVINRPFAHFETVVLNESTNFDDLDEVDEKSDVDEVADEDIDQEIDQEVDQNVDQNVVVEEEIPMEEQRVVDEVQPIEEEQAAEEVPQEETEAEPAEVVIEEETPIEEVTPNEEETPIEPSSEELIAIAAAAVKQQKMEHDSFCRKSKRRISCCIIACSVLLGIVIGGFSTIFLVGTKYDKLISTRTVESMVSSFLDKKDIVAEKPVEVVVEPSVAEQPVEQPATKPVEQPATKPVEQPEAKPVEQPVKQVAKPTKKPVYLSEKIEYKITGTITTYTLREGETLTRVALKYYGNKKIWPYLVMHNKNVITNPDNVPIGTTIKVPKLTPVTPK